MKKRLTALLLLAGLLCAVLSGCGDSSAAVPSKPEETTRASSNEIVVAIPQDLDDSLDPHKTVKAGTREVMFNVFEGLLKPTTDGDLACALASDYKISDDRLTYTFTLRDGVKYHNGETVTADDVVYSLLRCRGDMNDEGVLPIEALSNMTDVQATDDHTVVITLAQPNNEFLSYMTTAILPADYDQQDSAPVGTGPFRFVSRTAQDSVVLEKFDEYWGEPAHLDKVTLKIIENSDSLLMSLQSGAIDLCAHLTTAQMAQLGDSFDVAEGTMNLVQALYLNNAEKPFDDVRVRQALCYAVDKQAIIDLAFDGYGTPIGSSMYPAFGKYFDDSLTNYYAHDNDKAKELLADAGYPDGFEMTITVPSNYKVHMDAAEVIVNQLADIGVTATIQPIEWESWLSDVYYGRQFQSTVVGLDASTMTARAMLERFVSDSGKNFINYSNADYDALFQQVQTTYDDAAQTKLYKDMERNLTENAANVYLQDLADLVAVRKGLDGVQFYPIYVLDLSGVQYTA